MVPDSLGLIYPIVDTKKCIECGLCVSVCPFIKESPSKICIKALAAVNSDEEERMSSSSGGIFIRLAKEIINKGGVIFGAVFNNDWQVYHCSASSLEEVFPMMRSKYLQSNTLNTYSEAKRFLEEGRFVMYTGTPCQIAGLDRYLRKAYDKLLLVEIICHGVPAPGIWDTYLKEKIRHLNDEQENENSAQPPSSQRTLVISDINFRGKGRGWKNFSFEFHIDTLSRSDSPEIFVSKKSKAFLHSMPFSHNEYMHAFLRNWSLRPSCYECKAKNGKSGADLTIGDFWGVEKVGSVIDDDKGVSCVVCRSQKGIDAIESSTGIRLFEVPYATIYDGNQCIEKSVRETEQALRFKRLFQRHGFFRAFHMVMHPSLFYRGMQFLKRHLNIK